MRTNQNARITWVIIILYFIIWQAPRAGKMKQILRRDWLPERARWSHLARPGLPAASRKKNFPKSHIIDPLLTKFVWSRWLDIVSVHKHAKKELGQYPAILTSHLINNPYQKQITYDLLLPIRTLRYSTLHYAALRHSSLHYATLLYATLRFTAPLYSTLCFCTLLCNTLPCTSLV